MAGNGDVNPMLPGQKVIAIFGFCDIRNFTDATEVLQEGVMLFVNEIGEIVHGVVYLYSGAANKNIGDAFLLVWKFVEDDIERDEELDTLKLKKNNRVSQLADMSAISFLKIISAVKTSRKLVKYKENKALNERMPNYSVKMGYGLHVGWAIEGAIGSFYKIDASYLSPNVNMASRLEGATK
jgi:class 3 adenylate cyclase